MSTEFECVIGLEVHAQLLTKTKLFCNCPTTFGAPPNSHICPVCTGQPGALPVLNRKAVEFAIRAGLATHCTIDEHSVFARKNYFYPDLPKGYQISQYDRPICREGVVEIEWNDQIKSIQLIRIHMEEDAGKLVHDYGNPDASHVDLNRACVPLIEIVSGPDIRSAQEAVVYLKTLRNILMYLEVCDGNMQEGSLRCDANVSVRPKGESKLGTRTELKNLNSFRSVERAIEFEIKRQIEVIEDGEKVIQETRLWDDAKQESRSMRGKEEAHDYRYFPDPDLMPVTVTQEWIEDILSTLPELASAKAARFVKDYGIPEYDARILTAEKALAHYYEEALKHYNQPKKIANWIITELLGRLNANNATIEDAKIKPTQIAALVKLIDDDVISGKIAKDVIVEMFDTGNDPEAIVKAKGLVQVSDTGAIEAAIADILAKNPDNVASYKSGKTQVFGFFVGQVIKAMQGKANPKVVNELLRKHLD
ncbi:MAG: Asp-tRNA(Asn)/Glu-tRNA(Gln) amidotransferase GatCAB subunit B [Deltaproteobacteria bacterium CG11_big_fil_rev_8_21_14_0_20_47_16]|nr:MAG: Asp-tRNA(Asn)/Glu-tRNA(Gln) amidotransferase GatCAB subunit B [Deltaproteobacteria bacterium CG11_big_fil_rev_8_21_14_0_20_47_16]